MISLRATRQLKPISMGLAACACWKGGGGIAFGDVFYRCALRLHDRGGKITLKLSGKIVLEAGNAVVRGRVSAKPAREAELP